MSTLDALLATATAELSQALGLPVREARLEAGLLAGHALGVNRAWLIAHGSEALSPTQQARIETFLARRREGEPVAYILGEREFYGRVFRLTPDTLIPRPETEHLVEAALTRAAPGARVLDVGTGSGCIAISLKLERPDLHVTAVDLSPTALLVAQGNAKTLGAEIAFLESDLFAGLPDREFDLIVSNPPYIAEDDAHLGRGDLRFEPRQALASGPDGLDAIRAIAAAAPGHLAPGGCLLIEHGWDQAPAVANILGQVGFEALFQEADLAGHTRLSGGMKRGGASPTQ